MTDAQTEARAIARGLVERLNGEAAAFERGSDETDPGTAALLREAATDLAAKEAELVEKNRLLEIALRETAPARDAAIARAERAEAQLAEAKKALEQRDTDITEFMGRLGSRWFLEQGWFPKSVEVSDAV